MKKVKRLSALIIAIFILVLSLPTVPVFAEDPDMRYGRTKLNNVEQKLYDRLVSGCANSTADIEIDKSWNITTEQLHKTYQMFYSDYPEYFWVTNGGYSWLSNSSSIVISISPSYCFSNVAASKSAYDAAVNEMVSGLNGKSDYEKAKILHDRLIDKVTYKKSSNDQNAYGALVEGEAVCNGYARAYQHLMNKAGIPAWYVSGTSVNPSTKTTIGHAWNLVKLDGNWYYTDVTWDDQGENTFYEYLNVTTDKILKDHTLDSVYEGLVPQATDTSAGYYKKEGREFTEYDQGKLIELLKKDNNKTQIYITGDADDFLDTVSSNLLSIGQQLGGSTAVQISSNIAVLKNAAIIKLIVIPAGHTHQPHITVNQVDATQFLNGKKLHYICNCGIMFLDKECTNQVSASELVIPALPYTPSDDEVTDSPANNDNAPTQNDTTANQSQNSLSNEITELIDDDAQQKMPMLKWIIIGVAGILVISIIVTLIKKIL